MSGLAEKFVAALVDGGDAGYIVRHPEVSVYLSHTQSDASLYALVEEHLKNYGKLPSRATLEEQWGQPLPEAIEPPKFYLDQLVPMHTSRTLQAAAVQAQPHILKNPNEALLIMEKAVHTIRMLSQAMSVMDLRDAKSFILKNLATKTSGIGSYSMGWGSYDKVSGGLMPGDLVSIVGRSGLGKTMLLLSRALHLWKTLGIPVTFISMEMMLAAILERAAAMLAEVPMDYVKKGMLPNLNVDFGAKLVKALDAAAKAPVPFHFVDGNLAVTPKDVQRLCSQLQPKVLVVDGAYLLASDGYKKHEVISNSVGFLKQIIATQMEIPVLASYQFNRDATKLKKGEQVGLEHIGGSDDIGRLSSVVLGLFQNDTPETIHRRKVSILKGRGGEIGSFYVNWDFGSMDFEEVAELEPDVELDIT